MNVAMSLRGRGSLGSMQRAGRVLARFGATASAMSRRLDRYEQITSDLGVQPTWPTTACVLARHPSLLRAYSERGVELALHGLVHGDHAALDRREQREAIARAIDIFRRSGISPVGFRGPYLLYNDATLDVLRELGMSYHCSQAVAFPVLRDDGRMQAMPSYRRALQLYSALDSRGIAVRPKMRDGLVDIPVAIPDDEILLDRLGLDESERAAEWLHILDLTYAAGDLFTIQLHPERIFELAAALRKTLAETRRRRPVVFIATLGVIAEWWLRRRGFKLHVIRAGDDRYRVRLDADADATLLVRGLDVARTSWHGRDAISSSHEFETNATRVPVVGVSRRTPAGVHAFLTEEGLPFEVSDDAPSYGAHVDVSGPQWTETQVLGAIEGAAGPLVRLGRWPSGARSALAVTGDVDALTLQDFALRFWETRRSLWTGANASAWIGRRA